MDCGGARAVGRRTARMVASTSSIGLKARLEPGTLIASFGLAFAMFLYDLKYMSSIVSVADNGLGKLMGGAAYLAVVLLVALACLARPAARIHRRTPLCAGVAFVQFASILVALDAGIVSCGEQAKMLFNPLSQCCNAFLLACWADITAAHEIGCFRGCGLLRA